MKAAVPVAKGLLPLAAAHVVALYWLMRDSEAKNRPALLSAYLAIAASVLYVSFAFFAFLRYPAPFGPWNNNWLSDLGNRLLNPQGATLYVIGCSISGALILGFFGSLAVWRRSGSHRQNWLLLFIQLAGALAAWSLIMSAVYTEDQFNQHQFWSRLIYAGFALVFFLSPFALRRRGRRLWPVVVVAVIGYAAILASFIYSDAHWLEWPSVAAIMAYACVVGSITVSTGGSPIVSSRSTAHPTVT